LEDAVQLQVDPTGEEQEQAAELGAELPRLEVELCDVGRLGAEGTGPGEAFFVRSAWESGEAFLGKESRDGDGADGMSLLGERPADVLDGEVLFAEGDDMLPEVFVGAVGLLLACGRQEERACGVVAELVDEASEAAWGVAQACGGRGGGESLDKGSAEGLVRAMGGVRGLAEEVREC
jgi:hypothetical protein